MTQPLNRLIELEKDARKFGFTWPDQQMIIDQIMDETLEVKDSIKNGESKARVQEEIGDLLQVVISLCITAGFDVHETIDKTNEKFGARMSALKQISANQGLANLHGKSMDFTLKLWNEAKKIS